jgi:hypothetical protein
MPLTKTSIVLNEKQEKLLQEKMQEWNETRSGALRRIQTEWEQYDEMFHGSPSFARSVKTKWMRNGGR